jgi:pimeloyl-ACP methyl ester carboxylesterase
MLGSGANWRSFARQIVSARPALGALLVDLRLHGDSLDFDPPHTVEAAARDVLEALATPRRRVHAALGHSFGGKVALELARQISVAASPLDHLFVIDSTPGARLDHRGSSGVRHIVELLTELPEELPDRDAFTTWIEERGVSRATAMWLAMNVRPVPNTSRYSFRLDIPLIRAMLDDYFTCDLWPVVEQPPGMMQSHLIAGGRSDVVAAADLERARRCRRATVDVIPEAGHWVHVDAPDRLRELVLDHLDR